MAKQVSRVISCFCALLLLAACGAGAAPSPAGSDAPQTVMLQETSPAALLEGEDPATYVPANGTKYNLLMPGIINQNEGTLEFTVRIDKDYEEFGNTWNSIFTATPQNDDGELLSFTAYVPPSDAPPINGSYAQNLAFEIGNGAKEGAARIGVWASPQSIAYTKDVPFNLAFCWKLGEGGYVAIYKDGAEVARTNGSIAPIEEESMRGWLSFCRTAPFAVSNIKVSTVALPAESLETATDSFTRGEDTALLADVTFGQEIVEETFTTPYHKEAAYSVVKPIYMLDDQVYYAGEGVYQPLLLLNHSGVEQTYTVSATGTNQNGVQVFSLQQTLTLAADGKYHGARLLLPIEDAGYYDVQFSVQNPDGKTFSYGNQIAIVPVPDDSPDGAFAGMYGQHLASGYSFDAFEKLNVSVMRGWDNGRAFQWYNIEPENDRFEWDITDDYVQQAQEYGIDICAVLGSPSAWASARPDTDFEVAHPIQYRSGTFVSKDIQAVNGVLGEGDLWRDYVYQVMKRYAGKVKYYEVVNEVNFHTGYYPYAFQGTTEEYLLMQKIAYEEAQRVKREYLAETGEALELYVTTSGFSPYQNNPDVDAGMVYETLRGENVQYYDIFSIHSYATVEHIQPILNALEEARRQNPDLQLWQSEYFAFHETDTTGRMYTTVENCIEYLSAGASMYINMGVPDTTGFVDPYSQSPTVLFQAMAVLQQNLRKADAYIGTYEENFDTSLLPVRHCYRRADGKYLSILASRDARSITIDNPAAVLSAMDAFGVPVTLDGNVMAKQNNLFIVSDAPLEISAVQ